MSTPFPVGDFAATELLQFSPDQRVKLSQSCVNRVMKGSDTKEANSANLDHLLAGISTIKTCFVVGVLCSALSDGDLKKFSKSSATGKELLFVRFSYLFCAIFMDAAARNLCNELCVKSGRLIDQSKWYGFNSFFDDQFKMQVDGGKSGKTYAITSKTLKDALIAACKHCPKDISDATSAWIKELGESVYGEVFSKSNTLLVSGDFSDILLTNPSFKSSIEGDIRSNTTLMMDIYKQEAKTDATIKPLAVSTFEVIKSFFVWFSSKTSWDKELVKEYKRYVTNNNQKSSSSSVAQKKGDSTSTTSSSLINLEEEEVEITEDSGFVAPVAPVKPSPVKINNKKRSAAEMILDSGAVTPPPPAPSADTTTSSKKSKHDVMVAAKFDEALFLVTKLEELKPIVQFLREDFKAQEFTNEITSEETDKLTAQIATLEAELSQSKKAAVKLTEESEKLRAELAESEKARKEAEEQLDQVRSIFKK